MFHWYLTMFCADQLTSASSTVGLGADHLEKLMKLVQTTKGESRLACSGYVCVRQPLQISAAINIRQLCWVSAVATRFWSCIDWMTGRIMHLFGMLTHQPFSPLLDLNHVALFQPVKDTATMPARRSRAFSAIRAYMMLAAAGHCGYGLSLWSSSMLLWHIYVRWKTIV